MLRSLAVSCMGKPTLQGIMKTAYKAYESTHNLPHHVRKAARALMKCRTAELGGHVQACPEGHYQPAVVQLMPTSRVPSVQLASNRAVASKTE